MGVVLNRAKSRADCLGSERHSQSRLSSHFEGRFFAAAAAAAAVIIVVVFSAAAAAAVGPTTYFLIFPSYYPSFPAPHINLDSSFHFPRVFFLPLLFLVSRAVSDEIVILSQ